MTTVAFPCTGAPTLDQVAAIVALDDPVLRNLLITQTYHQLSNELRRILGVDHANWCTFATWASKQAGHTIRGEDLPARIHHALPQHHVFAEAHDTLSASLWERFEVELVRHLHLGEHVLHLVERLSTAIAEGNLKVFAELAPLFVRFIEVPWGEAGEDEDFEVLLAGLTHGPTEQRGQELLRAAFLNYRASLREPRAKAKMEYIVAANAQIGLHEQTRLQPNIAAGLETPVEVIESLAERIVHDLAGRIRGVLHVSHHEHVHPVCAPHAGRLAHAIAHVWCREATDHIMKLAMPDMVLHLGADVPSLPHGAMFPDGLEHIEHEDLVALARTYDHSWNTTVGSRASDWTSLADRMHYIIDLFRSRHRHDPLHAPPFSPDQVRDIETGRVASGAL